MNLTISDIDRHDMQSERNHITLENLRRKYEVETTSDAYDKHGNRIKNMFAVYVKKKAIEFDSSVGLDILERVLN